MVKDMQQDPSVRLSGDGRYDSTGHLAKYLSYSFLNMKTGLVAMVKLVQVSMITSYLDNIYKIAYLTVSIQILTFCVFLFSEK